MFQSSSLSVTVFSGLQKSVMQTGPSPVTWAPTSSNRQSKTLSPGSRLDKSEESRLSLLPSPPPTVPKTFKGLPTYLCLIPPWQERQRANQLLLVPPFFSFLCFFFFFFLMFLVVVQKINHLNFLHCVDWCVTTLSDDCVWHKACKQMTNQSSPIKETQIITDQTMIKNDDFFFWRTLHCRSKFSSNGTLCYAHVYVLRSETDKRGAAFSRRHVDGSFTSDVNKVLDSLAAKEYLLWVMTSKPSGER